jgi:glycosyltransferase involved in cell wall biosynthesis
MRPDPEIAVATGASLPDNSLPSPEKPRLLAIVNIDSMVWVLLRPWLRGLQEAGYEVHIACARGEYFARLAALGFQMHAVSIRRSFRPWAHVRPFFELLKIVRRGGFEIVNTHSAVAAAVGRIAAWAGGCRVIVYTVHGFYFHDNMPTVPRSLFMILEWLLGRFTKFFMFVSDEDHRTSIRTGIVPAKSRSITIFNGVDLDVFRPRETCADSARVFKCELGIDDALPVVGIVGRIVREKGHREFLEMARYVVQKRKAIFLVVGDTLPSDRDQFGEVFKKEVTKAGLTAHFLFTGQTDRVPDYLRIMDIFVLPSYREGFPRSIVEAMSTGIPVIATDIRGCREAVVHGTTGLIVPPKDGEALAHAVEHLLGNPEEATSMGRAGRKRAVELYDYRIVQRRFVDFIDEALRDTVSSGHSNRLD